MNNVNFFKIMIKGFIVGGALIVPGFSGSTIALMLNIYEDLLDATGHFFKHIKQSLTILIPFGLGVILALIILFFPLQFLFSHYPLLTTCLFVGLLINGLEEFISSEINSFKFIILVMLGFFLFQLMFSFKEQSISSTFFMSFSLMHFLYFVGAGFIASLGLIAPCLSVTFLLMAIGFYHPFLNVLSSFPPSLNNYFYINIFVFSCSLIFFTILLSRLFSYLLKRWRKYLYPFLIGILFNSLLQAFINIEFTSLDASFSSLCYTFIASITLLIIGYIISIYLKKLMKKK